MDASKLSDRDFTIIIDKSGSMNTVDCNGKSRWAYAKESVFALAAKCEEFDPDGITLYTFSSSFKRYDNVTSSKVEDIWRENDPMGGTALDLVLHHAISNFFERKVNHKLKTNGEIMLVITDGEPNDRAKVEKEIIDATKNLSNREELGISFIQIGYDAAASTFLKLLDDGLEAKGAVLDIVDTVTIDDAGDRSLIETLVNAISD